MLRSMLPSRLSFSVLVTALLIPSGQAAAAGDLGVNMLSNPGFSGTSGWSLEEGTISTRSSDPSPNGGSYFYAGENPQTTIYQEIDVEALGYDTHRLDTGGYYAKYGGYHRSMDQGWWVEDRGLISLRMQDASEAQIGQSNLGWGDSTTWYLRQGSARLAVGTRQLKYRFQAQRLTPTGENNAYFDGAFLELYEYAIWTWGDDSHDYADTAPWTVNEMLLIGAGEDGTGGLEITNAATLTTNGSTYVGELATSDGTVNVAGGTWDANADVYVGTVGTGRVNVTGGTMNATNDVNVGANGTLTVDGQLSLGGAGAVTVGNTLLLDGGRVACTTFDNTSGGTFQFNSGTLAYSGDLAVDSATIFGAAGVDGDTISSGRTLEVAGGLELDGLSAELTLDGGRVACATFENSSGGTFQFNGGTLAYQNDLVVDSTTIFGAVGGDAITSARTLEVADTLTVQAAGAITLDGGRVACTTFDNTSGGTFQFDGGTLAFATNLTIDSDTPFGAVGNDTISSGRTLEIANTLTLGATGTLTLDGGSITCSALDNSAGGTLNHDAGTLTVLGGAFDPGTANYSVDGSGIPELHLAGSGAALAGDLVVADTTNGTLTITGGGSAASNTGYIGRSGTAIGTVTVEDAGSIWNVADSLYVGGSDTAAGGPATLTVRNGGAVNVTNTLKLWNGGMLTIDGGRVACTTLDNSSAGTFQFDAGTLAFHNDLTVDSDTPFGGAGDTISSGRTLEVAGTLSVAAVGELTVDGGHITCTAFDNSAGGVFTHNAGTLDVIGGAFNPGAASYYIDGPGNPAINFTGGTAALTNQLRVADTEDGTMTITDGGIVGCDIGYVGTDSSAVGTVTIDGVGSTWNSTNYLCVARYGDGTLNIINGGSAHADGNNWVASRDNSVGSVTVEGTGAGGAASQWNSTEYLCVAHEGSGTLSINAGGTVHAGGSGYIARASGYGSDGTVTVDGAGSTLTIDDSLYVGGSDTDPGGTAKLTVQNDGAVTVANTIKIWDAGTIELLGSQINTGSFLGAPTGTFTHDAGTLTVLGGTFDPPGTAGHMIDGLGNPTIQLVGSSGSLSGALGVGHAGTGTLEITGGGSLLNTYCRIGNEADSEGSVTVDGSTWTNSQSLYVGHTGTGTLTIRGGAGVASSHGFIATDSGSQGTVTVEDANSAWNMTDSLFIGGGDTTAGGTGTLTVQDDATVDVTNTLKLWNTSTLTLGGGRIECGIFDNSAVGAFNFNAGTLAFAGDLTVNSDTPFGAVGGDAITSGRVLEVGGTLSVAATPAELTLDGGRIECGAFDNSSGGTFNFNSGTLAFADDLTIDSATPFGAVGGDAISAGRVLEVAGHLLVYNGPGVTMEITGGGSVLSSFGYIGQSEGAVTVDGAGASWTSSSGLLVGSSGVGSLEITSGGSVSSPGLVGIGYNSGAEGAVRVDGTDSTWNCAGAQLLVGFSGTGTLDITGGAEVSSGSGYIGPNAAANGDVTVDGTDSTWTIDDSLYVGGNNTTAGGTGKLTVQNDGIVDVGDTITVWDAGTVELLGSQIITGSFVVTSAGTFTHDDGILAVSGGTFDPGTADYTIDGAAAGDLPAVILTGEAACDLAGALTVGDNAAGRLEIAGGTVSNVDGHISALSGAEGVVTVFGANSQWDNSGLLIVGEQGVGMLAITNDGTVSSSDAYIGYRMDAEGSVTVDGSDSEWTNTQVLYVGGSSAVANGSATGTLEITGGGDVSCYAGWIGDHSGAEGTVTVDGAGSTWSPGSLRVGAYGTGTVEITGSGTVSSHFGSVANYAGSDGTVTVLGNGSTWTNLHWMHVGGSDTAAGGTGTLTASNGGTVDAGGMLKIWNSGTVNVYGGTIRASEFVVEDGTCNFSYGTLVDTDDLAISPGDGVAAMLGGSHTIGLRKHLQVNGTTTLGNLLVLDAGEFSTAALVNPELFEFTRGTFNLTGDNLVIGPGGVLGAALTLPADKAVNVTNDTTVEATGQLVLQNGSFSSAATTNSGLIRGTGAIDGAIDNGATGTILVTAADYLDLTDTLDNSGQVSLIGGTIRVAAAATNAADGVISGHGGLLFDGGLTNHGTMNFGADTEIYGDVANGEWDELGTDGEIVISGGASVSFHGDVASNGTKFKVSESADVVFFGTLSGVGSITGGGGVWIEGIFSPGNSPGDVLLGGDLALGPDALLQIELGGTEPSVDYDVLNVLGLASLDGTLDVALLDGFQPAAGDQFDVFNFASQSGAFNEILLPDLMPGLSWDDSQLAANGVVAVVPEPGTFPLMALGLLAMLVRRRKR